jgi:hypothetical protein
MKNPISASRTLVQCFCSFFLLIFFTSQIIGQKGIRLNTTDAYDGYVLCTADNGSTFLLDNCGEIVNTWTNTFPRYYCRLTEEGNLIFNSNNRIIERDWNNNTVNTININASDLVLDYEVMKLENGNFLAACRRLRSNQYFNNLGWSPSNPTPDRTDGVVEIDANGNIVWEWNIGDHTIQDMNSSVSNFGNIGEHPELVDINAISNFDWVFGESFMINSIDYNPELDQILLSVRKMSEIMVIDHSTTTQEAKGSTGGESGKGGDMLYRWGNPQNYAQGNESDRVLYFQHNPNWVKYEEHKGKIIVYNNGLDRFVPGAGTISSVHIVAPPIIGSGSYMLEEGEAYEPNSPDITIDKVNTGNQFYSGYTSGAQVLPNGNIYITVGITADFMEVKTDGTVVWDYSLANAVYIFRTEQYSRDFPGFEGKDMTANGTVEFPSSSYNCELFTSTEDISNPDFFSIHFDQISNYLTIQNLEANDNTLEIRNLQGQLVQFHQDVSLRDQFSLINLSTGIYFITLHDNNTYKRTTYEVFKY